MIGRVNAGGGGGLQSTDAILRVIAPAGSTVTISKGGVSKSDHGHENAADTSLYDYYFIIHASQFDSVNPWTVTATLGSDTASDTVVIDSADEYDVVLDYNLYLIRDGVFTTAYTHTLYGYSTATWTEESGYAQLYVPKASSSFSTGYFSDIDITDYLYIVCESSTHGYSSDSQSCPGVGVINVLNKNANPTTFTAWVKLMTGNTSTSTDTEGTFTVDISSLTGTKDIGIQVAASSSTNVTGQCKCYNLYLSKRLPS